MTKACATETEQPRSADTIAAKIVLGLLLDEIEDLRPGTANRLEARLDMVVASIKAEGGFNHEVAQQVEEQVRVLLNARNM